MLNSISVWVFVLCRGKERERHCPGGDCENSGLKRSYLYYYCYCKENIQLITGTRVTILYSCCSLSLFHANILSFVLPDADRIFHAH